MRLGVYFTSMIRIDLPSPDTIGGVNGELGDFKKAGWVAGVWVTWEYERRKIHGEGGRFVGHNSVGRAGADPGERVLREVSRLGNYQRLLRRGAERRCDFERRVCQLRA
jgi:hypothetical protein